MGRAVFANVCGDLDKVYIGGPVSNGSWAAKGKDGDISSAVDGYVTGDIGNVWAGKMVVLDSTNVKGQ